jgi:hypothetical protein
MTTTAIIFMVLAIAVVWGGLAVSATRLARHTRAENRDHIERDL